MKAKAVLGLKAFVFILLIIGALWPFYGPMPQPAGPQIQTQIKTVRIEVLEQGREK